ncbi:MAG: type II secretion system F family protein [Phycisphaerales bacterium]
MPTFRYQSAGSSATATIDAPDRASAVRELVRRGVTPTKIEIDAGNSGFSGNSGYTGYTGNPGRSIGSRPASNGKALRTAGMVAGHVADEVVTGGAVSMGVSAAALVARGTMSRAEMAAFIRELATAVQAGLPLVQALRTIARQGRSDRQRTMLGRIIEEVEHGKSLGEAMAAQGRSFSELTVNLVRAGEASGKLDEVLTQAADLLDRDVKLRRSVTAATLYPAILACLIVVAVIVVVTFIVPKILKSIAGQVVHMPWPTRVVQGVAGFFADWWWLIIPAVLVGFLATVRTFRKPGPRMWLDTHLLSVPILGRLLRDVAVARFTRTLGTLVSAGIPAVAALRVTKGTLGNKAMERVIDDVCDQVSAGRTIADPMEKSGYFPPMLVQIVNMGERSGRLDKLLNQAAGAFEDRTETSVKLFTTALPPLLVVMLACVVGFVVLSILLPLLELQEAVR